MKNTKHKIWLVLAFLLILIGFLLYFKTAYAFSFGGGNVKISIGKPDATPFAEGDLEGVVSKIFNVVIIISEIAFMVLLLVGGIMYLTAGLSESQGEKARKLMLDAIVGLVIVLASWAIGTWIITKLTTNTPAGGGTSSTVPSPSWPTPPPTT